MLANVREYMMFHDILVGQAFNESDGGNIFLLSGEIDEIIATEFSKFVIFNNNLEDPPELLSCIVNSPGGCVDSGFAIIDMIQSSKIPVQTIVSGQASSMGLMILASGEKGKRFSTKHSSLMSHIFSTFSEGKYHDLVNYIHYLKSREKVFVDHLVSVTGLSASNVRKYLTSEKDNWFSPDEALKLGLIDSII